MQDEKCDEAFKKLKEIMTNSPGLICTNWYKPFRGQVNISQMTIGATPTQLDENSKDRVICYFPKKIYPAEKTFSVN